MAYPQIRDRSILLWIVLNFVDIWRSYASPLQHPWFNRASTHRSRRDIPYILSIVASFIIFVIAQYKLHPFFLASITAISVYRSLDILVSIARIAVVGSYGQTPAYMLDRFRIMRNTVAILINYVELIFWYAAVYLCLSVCKPAEFNVALTPALAFILSYSTISTVGYGNVAPQGMIAALFCAAQVITAVLTISSVVGSLINFSASPSQNENHASDEEKAGMLQDATRLTMKSDIWLVQRFSVLGTIIFLSHCFLYM